MKIQPVEITGKFVEALNKKFEGKETPTGPIRFVAEHSGKQGRRNFDKIVVPVSGGASTISNVHAFVDRQTGELYRAASWGVPVDDSRYDLTKNEDFILAVELSDPYGNYLRRNYARKTYAGII